MPFTPQWLTHLHTRVAFFGRLEEPLRGRFLGLVQAFVHEKHWIGANGLVVDDEMKVTSRLRRCALCCTSGCKHTMT